MSCWVQRPYSIDFFLHLKAAGWFIPVGVWRNRLQRRRQWPGRAVENGYFHVKQVLGVLLAISMIRCQLTESNYGVGFGGHFSAISRALSLWIRFSLMLA